MTDQAAELAELLPDSHRTPYTTRGVGLSRSELDELSSEDLESYVRAIASACVEELLSDAPRPALTGYAVHYIELLELTRPRAWSRSISETTSVVRYHPVTVSASRP